MCYTLSKMALRILRLHPCGDDSEQVRRYPQEQKILLVYKMVDTCAAGVWLRSYFYLPHGKTNPARNQFCAGSGPVRIGQGVESTMRPFIL